MLFVAVFDGLIRPFPLMYTL